MNVCLIVYCPNCNGFFAAPVSCRHRFSPLRAGTGIPMGHFIQTRCAKCEGKRNTPGERPLADSDARRSQ